MVVESLLMLFHSSSILFSLAEIILVRFATCSFKRLFVDERFATAVRSSVVAFASACNTSAVVLANASDPTEEKLAVA
eukprot:12951174-Ditylum_brightwellii.AAC.1